MSVPSLDIYIPKARLIEEEIFLVLTKINKKISSLRGSRESEHSKTSEAPVDRNG